MNLPNQITLVRFFLSLVVLGLLALFDFRQIENQTALLDWACALFIVAALSDALDGYLARRHNQVTSFGRILDPFVDKILVGGSFILLLDRGFCDEKGDNVTGLAGWMVVLILGRELLVSGLRGFSESGGKPYAANAWGKVKMVVQSITVPLILLCLWRWRDYGWAQVWRTAMIWITVVVTAASVIGYLAASRDALGERKRG